MAIHYVDYEGEAGSGDGSSFANRREKLYTMNVSAGDEVRIKQTPDPTVLSTSGKVFREHGAQSYTPASTTSNNIVYSTTEGGTYFNNIPTGWQTGDIMVICHHEAPAGQNLNGAWRITMTNGDAYFDGFTATSTDTVTSHYFRYVSATANSVTLGSSPVKVLASTDAARTAWTASSNVTTSIGYDSSYSDWNQYGKWQVPTGSDEIALTTSASTGKAAYFALGSSTDLSSYQQISFLFSVASGITNLTTNGDSISLRLCTDTQGDTSVHTIPINNGYSGPYRWLPVLKDFGSNLNSGIQSIAIYIDSTLSGNVTIRLNNIIASKASSSADSLTMFSMIGLNTTADKIWYPVGYIVDRGSYCLIILATWPQSRGNAGFGYYGNYMSAWWSQTFSSTTIYKREQVFPLFIQEGGLNSTNSTDTWTGSGSSGNTIVISGGWNSSDMTSIVGETFIRGSGTGYALKLDSMNYIEVKNIFYNGFNYGGNFRGNNNSIDNVGTCNAASYATIGGSNWQKFNLIYAYGGYSYGLNISSMTRDTINTSSTNFNLHYINSGQVNQRPLYSYGMKRINWNLINTEGTANDGLFFDGYNEDVIIDTVKCGWSRGGYAFRIYDSGNTSKNIRVKDLYMYTGGGIQIFSNSAGYEIDNLYSTVATYMFRFDGNYSEQNGYCVTTENNANLVIKDGSVMSRMRPKHYSRIKTIGIALDNSEYSSLKDTPTYIQSAEESSFLCKDYDNTSGDNRSFFGKGRVFPESTIRHTASGLAWKISHNPNELANRLNLEIGKVIVNSGSQVSISVWTYKSTSTAVGVLTIPADSLLGISSDVLADTSSASATTWTKITCTFTPTAAGVVAVKIGAYNTGSNEAVYFDDIEVTQA